MIRMFYANCMSVILTLSNFDSPRGEYVELSAGFKSRWAKPFSYIIHRPSKIRYQRSLASDSVEGCEWNGYVERSPGNRIMSMVKQDGKAERQHRKQTRFVQAHTHTSYPGT